ncbi:uncharacterized protein LOC131167862 [Malania oleifera]|uniref:uncharacterized protein LOC131167862 n=1 Tax=Malania oleifera TaxID=397392 RepID=UPI0025ADEF6A|nr:uncharacterized protein LOC131167862 [Malania oleifera]
MTHAMDLDEWEFLPDAGFLDYPEKDDPAKQTRSVRHNHKHLRGVAGGGGGWGSEPKLILDMNYFICPSPGNTVGSMPENSKRVSSDQFVSVPIQLELPPLRKKGAREADADGDFDGDEVVKKEITESVPIGVQNPDDQDTVSQVFFFKKSKETDQFVDMKMDSPRSSGRGILPPQIDANGAFQFEDEGEAEEDLKVKIVEKEGVTEMGDSEIGEEDEETGDNGGKSMNMWVKWGLTGIGALCSFGLAATTICILIFGTQERSKQFPQKKRLRYEIHADDQRIKQVVRHATKLNEAMSVVRGVPIARANITFGGYYDGL